MASRECRFITREFIRCMQGQFQTRNLPTQNVARLIHRATEMAIHRHNDDARS
jgi:hypothetical protein